MEIQPNGDQTFHRNSKEKTRIIMHLSEVDAVIGLGFYEISQNWER